MGDPVTLGVMAGVGGTAIAGSTYLSGRQQRNAYKMEAAQLQTQKKAIETNAANEQAERMRQLKTVLAAQNAAFAMSGQTAGVGSAAAIQSGSLSNAAREQRVANMQKDVATSALDYNIWSAKKTAHLAMGTSLLSTGLNAASRIGEAYVMNSFKSGGE